MWKLIEDEKPPINKELVVSDGNRNVSAVRTSNGDFMAFDGFDVDFVIKAWCEMPKWYGEITHKAIVDKMLKEAKDLGRRLEDERGKV